MKIETVTNTKASLKTRAVYNQVLSTMSKAKISKDARSIVKQLKDCKGQHVLVSWERPMKTRADVAMSIVKRTAAYVRAGIDYAKLASVKEGIESGERNEVQPLPWGEWVEFPFIIAHKGNEYLRLYPSVFDNLTKKIAVEYVMDGVVSTAEQVKPYCLASEFRVKDEPAKCFTINVDNILDIGSE